MAIAIVNPALTQLSGVSRAEDVESWLICGMITE